MFGHAISDQIRVEAEPGVVYFLAALVKALCPRYVIETGCYHGTTSAAIGEALDVGTLDTMDIDFHSVELASAYTQSLPVTVHHCSSLDFAPTQPIDLAFLDSDPYIRFQEAEYFRPFLAPDAILAIHDSRDMQWTDLDWRWVNLPTPRGLLLLQAN